MNETERKKDLSDIITTGPPVAGWAAPSKANIIDPIYKPGDIYSYERCTHCGYCRHVCKVYNTSWSET
ncbi:MAG: hypothetical protein Lokiarch_52750, partial [Candidatus Lokiarchaeum sp. GC14_75]